MSLGKNPARYFKPEKQEKKSSEEKMSADIHLTLRFCSDGKIFIGSMPSKIATLRQYVKLFAGPLLATSIKIFFDFAFFFLD